ncbi:MAG: TRAP transporter small permease [Aminivibrio sp.]|jgi:TRAP-type C4-dicarboxylate transport system permease small subunit
MTQPRQPETGAGGLSLAIRRLEMFAAWIACLLMLINVGDILLGIFCRYFLKSSIIWTEEAARFSLVWMVMTGAVCAAIRGDHMVIDFVVPRFPAFLRKLVEWARFILNVGLIGLMTWLGWTNAVQMWNMRTMAMNIPKTIPLLSVPAGFALLLAGTVLMQLKKMKGEN